MKNNSKFIRVIFIVSLFWGKLLCPNYASAETIPESVPNVHFFLEDLNSQSWIWFFRCVFMVGVLIASCSYLYFLNYKHKEEEEKEFFNTLGIEFTMQDEGRKK